MAVGRQQKLALTERVLVLPLELLPELAERAVLSDGIVDVDERRLAEEGEVVEQRRQAPWKEPREQRLEPESAARIPQGFQAFAELGAREIDSLGGVAERRFQDR